MEPHIAEEAARWREMMLAEAACEQEALDRFGNAGHRLVIAGRALVRSRELKRTAELYAKAGHKEGKDACEVASMNERERAVEELNNVAVLLKSGVQGVMKELGCGSDRLRAPRVLADYRQAMSLLEMSGVTWK